MQRTYSPGPQQLVVATTTSILYVALVRSSRVNVQHKTTEFVCDYEELRSKFSSMYVSDQVRAAQNFDRIGVTSALWEPCVANIFWSRKWPLSAYQILKSKKMMSLFGDWWYPCRCHSAVSGMQRQDALQGMWGKSSRPGCMICLEIWHQMHRSILLSMHLVQSLHLM
jgi:hypothetical protein